MKLRKACLSSPKLQKKRRARYFTVFSLSLVLIGCFFFGLNVFLSSGYISINNFFVVGNKEISVDSVNKIFENVKNKKIFGLINTDNFILFDKKNFLGQVYALDPIVKDLDTDFNGLNNLTLNILERVEFALWCYKENDLNEQCLIVDDSGFAFKVFSKNDFETGKIFIDDKVSTTSPKIGDYFLGDVKKIVDLTNGLEKFGWKVKRTSINEGFYVISLTSNSEIKLSEDFVLDETINKLSLIKQEIDKTNSLFKYIDLRFSGRAFIKR